MFSHLFGLDKGKGQTVHRADDWDDPRVWCGRRKFVGESECDGCKFQVDCQQKIEALKRKGS